MVRVLITGAGGFLGSHLVAESPLQTDLFGCTHTSPVNLKGDKWFRVSLTDTDHLQHSLDRIRPNAILHTAALSGEGACRADIDYARKVNVESCALLAEWCRANEAYLLFTSSDLVFDGRRPPYVESDDPNGEMIYGQLKAEAEKILLQYPNTLIVRLPLVYGIGLGGRKGLLHQFIQKASEGAEQRLFIDEFRMPACVSDVAEFIWILVDRRETGILHMGGRQLMSRFDMGRKYIECLGLPDESIKPIRRSDIGMQYRPEDTSMNSERAYRLGFDPRPIETCLEEIRKALDD